MCIQKKNTFSVRLKYTLLLWYELFISSWKWKRMTLPSENVLKRWREQFSLLDITNNKTLICKICCSEEDKLCSKPSVSMSFISGSSNYRLPALKIMAILLATNMKKSMKKLLQLENLYHQEIFSIVHLLQNHQSF